MMSSTAPPEAARRLVAGLRERGLTDERVLTALETVDRARFVPDELQHEAWADSALPIGEGQTISQPFVVALMTEALQLGERTRVLEVGTGSGYQAAILAQLARRVYTIERRTELLERAQNVFTELGLTNLHSRRGDGTQGWPEAAPFDAILVTAAATGERAPQALIDQLAEGGRLAIPLTVGWGDQFVYRLTRRSDGSVEEERLWPVRFVPLVADSRRTR